MSRGRHRRGRSWLWLFVGAVLGFFAVLIAVAVVVGSGTWRGSDDDLQTSIPQPVERAEEVPAPGAEQVPSPGGLAADVATDDEGEPHEDTVDLPSLSLDLAIGSIQEFWGENMVGTFNTDYTRVPQSRIVAMRPGVTSPRCDGRVAQYDDVEGNAFAASCREGELVAYDEPGLFTRLAEQYGQVGPVVVLAHEWGHVAQSQGGLLNRPVPTVLVEQQADCFAGAWVAYARDQGLAAELADASALDSMVAAVLEFRDQPGSSADSMTAHGSGFDRVRAFQEGFEGGSSRCSTYFTDPPTLTQIPFDARDSTGGNLPYADVLSNALVELNEFFGAAESEFAPITKLGPVGQAGVAEAVCNGRTLDAEAIKGYITYCAKERSVVFDDSLLRQFYGAIGDTSTFLLLGLQWAEAVQEQTGFGGARGLDDREAFLQQTCMVGGWVGDLVNGGGTVREKDLTLSAGDVDEAVILFVTLANSDAFADDTALFDVVDAFRGGVTSGFASCTQ